MATAAPSSSVEHKSRRTRLSSQTVEALRPPAAGQRLEVADTGCAGLRLRVSSHGAKTWSVVYRVRGDAPDGRSRGKPRRASLGAYPHVRLDEARDLARTALRNADEGVDYARRIAAAVEEEKRKAEAGGRDVNSVAVVCERFVDLYAKVEQPKSWRNAERWLNNVVVPAWGQRAIQDIKRSDVHALLDDVSRERSPKSALSVRKHLSALFNWAIDRDDYGLAASPIVGLKRGKKRGEKYEPRQNTLSVAELRRVWDAAGDMGYPFREMFRLLILTGQRRSEVANLQTDWLFERDDGARGVRVPAQDYKTGVAHEYPLSAPAAAIIDSLPRRKAGPYLLSGAHTKSPAGKAPVSGFSKAKARLDGLIAKRTEKARKEGVELPPMPEFTVHDIRRSVATGMMRLGVPPHHKERVLGHLPPLIVRVYDTHDYFPEKLAALELWGKQWS